MSRFLDNFVMVWIYLAAFEYIYTHFIRAGYRIARV